MSAKVAKGAKKPAYKLTKAGREAISKAQVRRWRAYRAAKRAKLAAKRSRTAKAR